MGSISYPKDGRYGWAVVAAAFAINFLADGLNLSSGIMMIEFLRHFDHGRGSMAFIGAVQTAVFHLVGKKLLLINILYTYMYIKQSIGLLLHSTLATIPKLILIILQLQDY